MTRDEMEKEVLQIENTHKSNKNIIEKVVRNSGPLYEYEINEILGIVRRDEIVYASKILKELTTEERIKEEYGKYGAN